MFNINERIIELRTQQNYLVNIIWLKNWYRPVYHILLVPYKCHANHSKPGENL